MGRRWPEAGPQHPKQGIKTSGPAPSLEEAKAQFLSNWQRCRADSTPPGGLRRTPSASSICSSSWRGSAAARAIASTRYTYKEVRAAATWVRSRLARASRYCAGLMPALAALRHGCHTLIDVVQAIADCAERRLDVFAIHRDGAGGLFDSGRGIG